MLTRCTALPLNIIEGLVSLNILKLSGSRENSHFALKHIKLCISVLVFYRKTEPTGCV